MRIELSRDGGGTWETLVASIGAGDDPFMWTVTGPASALCLVRITDADADEPQDISDGHFSFVAAPASSPNYTTPALVIDAGGGKATSLNFGTEVTIGDPAAGRASSANFQTEVGF